MADRKNPGQFGNRADTVEQARKGGLASSGSFGGANSADPRAAGRKGAKAQPVEAKAKGGRHSHRASIAPGASRGMRTATRAVGESGEPDDAIGLLRKQHGQIRTLFTETARAADTGERERKFFELRRLLAVHETAEEEIVHPRARRELDDGTAVVRARLEEENKAKQQLAELESLDVASAEFETKLARLERDVLAHAEHEEREEFAALRDELDPDELRRMRRLVELAESLAPTRPHPGVESAPANLLTGPFATMLDRARDAISRRGDA